MVIIIFLFISFLRLKREFAEHMSAHDQEIWKKKTEAQKQAALLKFSQEHGDELASNKINTAL